MPVLGARYERYSRGPGRADWRATSASEPRSSTRFVPGCQRIRFVSVPAGPSHADEDGLAAPEPDRVDVVLVVPEVERRLDPLRPAPEGLRVLAAVVVRLVPVARRDHAAELAQRGGDVEPAPAGEGVAARRARLAARRRVDVPGRLGQQRRHLLGTQVRTHGEEDGRGGRHLRSREGRPLALAPLLRPAAREALIETLLERRGHLERHRRDDSGPRRRDVVVDLVAVREQGDGAVAGERADAEDVRQRGRVARVRPRLGRLPARRSRPPRRPRHPSRRRRRPQPPRAARTCRGRGRAGRGGRRGSG